jgi:hypothetical protein
VSCGGVRLSPLDTSATNWFIVPAPDANGYEACGGMGIDKGNGNTRKKPAPVPLCPPQIPHDDLGSKPVTNRLSFGMAFGCSYTKQSTAF